MSNIVSWKTIHHIHKHLWHIPQWVGQSVHPSSKLCKYINLEDMLLCLYHLETSVLLSRKPLQIMLTNESCYFCKTNKFLPLSSERREFRKYIAPAVKRFWWHSKLLGLCKAFPSQVPHPWAFPCQVFCFHYQGNPSCCNANSSVDEKMRQLNKE